MNPLIKEINDTVMEPGSLKIWQVGYSKEGKQN